jgi:hypothetical protein
MVGFACFLFSGCRPAPLQKDLTLALSLAKEREGRGSEVAAGVSPALFARLFFLSPSRVAAARRVPVFLPVPALDPGFLARQTKKTRGNDRSGARIGSGRTTFPFPESEKLRHAATHWKARTQRARTIGGHGGPPHRQRAFAADPPPRPSKLRHYPFCNRLDRLFPLAYGRAEEAAMARRRR